VTKIDKKIDILLKSTSRSFYLSLNFLPKKIRKQIGLLYLLARLSDTIADSKVGDKEILVQFISQYNDRVQKKSELIPDLERLALLQDNPAEKKLLQDVSIPIKYLEETRDFSERDRQRISECLEIIIRGQILDLVRFNSSEEKGIVALNDEKELDDYTYSVAGSVGEFWTHMALDYQFEINNEMRKKLFETGIRFGKSLQLINILRDIPEDIAMGRCYIPKEKLLQHDLKPEDLLDSNNMEKFRPLYDSYISMAYRHLNYAIEWVNLLPYNQYRLRLSCILPILIGQSTLSMLSENNVLDKKNRIKVSRKEIKAIFRKSLFASLTKNKTSKLIRKNMPMFFEK
jgi:farnesyl-diphosphate farnesyltransferase